MLFLTLEQPFYSTPNLKAVEPLIQLLQDQDPNVRNQVVYALGQLRNEKAVEPLIQLLQDQNPKVRGTVVSVLAQFQNDNDKVIMSLVKFLKDQYPSVRQYVKIALGAIDNKQIVKPLTELLRDHNPGVRSDAAFVLGRLGQDEAINLLLSLLTDQNQNVRFISAQMLSELGSGKAIEPLSESVQLQVGFEQSVSLLSLSQLESDEIMDLLIQHLEELETPYVEVNIAESFGRINHSKGIIPLITQLKKQPRYEYYNDDQSSYIIEILGQLGSSEAISPLLQILRQQEQYENQYYQDSKGLWNSSLIMHNDLRGSAAKALAELNVSDITDSLIKILNSSDTQTQRDVALVIGKLSVYRGIEPLKTLYAKLSQTVMPHTFSYPETTPIVNNIFSVKLAIAATLVSLGQEDLLEFLQKEAKSEQDNEREEVANVLGEIPSKGGTEILLGMLNDEEADVKIQVIASLGETHATSILPHLYKLLDDPNPKIRKTVVDALGEIASSDSIDLLKQTALNTEERVPTRIAAINGLGKIGTEQAATTLLEILDKVNKHYHYKTIMALGKTRSKQALPKLLELLREQERRKVDWRKVRDENTDSYDDKQMEEWRKRLAAVEPQTYMEFELAHSIAMIDPDGEGVKLLSHDLAKIREGAWMGLARLPLTVTRPFYVTNGPAAVNLIARLDKERKASGNPFFEHAAYRAIDEMLIALEAYGRKPELDALQAFLSKVQDAEGVKTRVEWTIDRLKERKEE